MRLAIVIVLSLIAFIGNASIDVKIYYEPKENGFKIYADNNEYCPVSIKIDFQLQNLSASGGNGKIFVIPARAQKHVLTELTKLRSGKTKFSYKTRYNYGDHYLKSFDNSQEFPLPFPKDSTFKVSQGYNGKSTHQGKNALDIKMPIGTEIMAIKGGKVIKVVDHNTKTCYKKECEEYNNLIIIYHEDGTFAEYTHINTNSALVEVGDTIKMGQVIAKSGNIGRSSGPHLHLVVFIQKLEVRRMLKTKFRVNNGNTSQFLIEGKSYTKGYH